MEACCFNYYAECNGLIPCFDTMWVKVPFDYEDPTIKVKIYKNNPESGVMNEAVVSVNNLGFIGVESYSFGSGFFNQYARYRLEFWGNNGYELLSFIAKDGKQYQGIDFFFNRTNQINNYITLNAFDNTYYD